MRVPFPNPTIKPAGETGSEKGEIGSKARSAWAFERSSQMRWGDYRGSKAIAPSCLVALGLLVLALAFFSATVHSAPSSDLQAAPVATIPPPVITDTCENLELYGAQVSAIAIDPGSNSPTAHHLRWHYLGRWPLPQH